MTLRPGHYELICNLPNHYADGMYQELVVTCTKRVRRTPAVEPQPTFRANEDVVVMPVGAVNAGSR